MDRVDLVYTTLSFAKTVDLHPQLPWRCDQFKRVIQEWEYVLEDPAMWSSDMPELLDDWEELPDRDLLLAQIDVAGGGWHRS